MAGPHGVARVQSNLALTVQSHRWDAAAKWTGHQISRCSGPVWHAAHTLKIGVGLAPAALCLVCLVRELDQSATVSHPRSAAVETRVRTCGAQSPASTARVVWSGPRSSTLSIDSSSANRPRARLTRLLIVPIGQRQMAAASSYDNPEAPTRMSASR